MNSTFPQVIFSEPDIHDIRKSGLAGVDMHFHTNHSDSPTRVRDALALAKKKGIGLAITDHNAVSGVTESERQDASVLLIPGIEISAWDGPHILLYFFSVQDLTECYEKHIKDTKSASPCLATTLTTPDIAALADDYNCVMVAAHPFGYLLFNKGLAKCIERQYLPPRMYNAFDGLEVISGGMSRKLNKKAAEVAKSRGMCITGGTDGHILPDLGHVLTCAHAETTEEFLEAVMQQENCVIGREKNLIEKCVMASAMLPQYLPYTIPSLEVHYRQNIPRVRHFFEKYPKKTDKKQ
ncbi:histidinol phosphatase [Methanogenium marinum]|uniref:Histidinol phosphatase n=1 Tax=Methanogenium marinum TaxID=348610 RepID=A0A9Q4PVW2_9EURY|nr:PHP-associated domain-containing protein [Methanogenium marinum]MDE4908440.1 histidinol phosphatase [Methanogenium marinum]